MIRISTMVCLTLLPGILAEGQDSPCHLGYSKVCSMDSNKDDMQEVCPFSPGGDKRGVADGECACLPTRGVEQDMAAGISPLGTNIQDCVRVSSDLMPPYQPANISSLMDDWNIEKISGSNEVMKTALMAAMQEEMDLEKSLKKASHPSRFIRSTDRTDWIAHNYRIMQSLEIAADKGSKLFSKYRRRREAGDSSFLDTCQNLTDLATHPECQQDSGCDPDNEYRTFQGCCNNLQNKTLGSANTAFPRLLASDYQDQQSLPRGGLDASTLPGARPVSSTVFTVGQDKPAPNISLMVMQFGQFLDHDITLTPEQELECCNQDILNMDMKLPKNKRHCFNINTTNDLFYSEKTVNNAMACMPFTRSDAICSGSRVREQFNANSAFIDASMVYGSDQETATKLRKMSGGQLSTHKGPSLPTLPTRKQSGFDFEGEQNPEDLVSGDVRTIEQPGLASMHSLFLSEHNLIASWVGQLVPDWSDEQIYQYTRHIVAAEIQNIVFNEFLPIVLGTDMIRKYDLSLPEDVTQNTKYNPQSDPSIVNEFATSAFRFGHSLIPNMFLPSQNPIRTKNRCPLMGNFFAFQQFVIGDDTSGKGWHNLLQGITSQQSPAMDASIDNNFLDYLFCDGEHELCNIPGGFGQDLGARNIQRGRDHGLPGYNNYRKLCGLPEISSLTESGRPSNINSENWRNILTAYAGGDMDDIDLFVGGLAEDSLPDALVGQTFACIIGEQFKRLKEGDRFFFTHPSSGAQKTKGLSQNLRNFVRNRPIGTILCQNTEMLNIPAAVMRLGGEEIACPTINSQKEHIRKDLSSRGYCPDGWVSFNGNCYGHPKDTLLNWADAESHCQGMVSGAHLASIHSAQEQQFVVQTFPSIGWLGGNDIREEGTWVWSDGTPMDFTNWKRSQPDNGGGNQDCLDNYYSNPEWDDNFCYQQKLFLCKYQPTNIGRGTTIDQLIPMDAVQSSTHTCGKPETCGPAKFSIDGEITTFSHTLSDQAPWIALRFSSPVLVQRVEILYYDSRVRDLEVRVTNNLPEDGATVFTGGKLLGGFAGPGTPGQLFTWEGPVRQGRFLLVQMKHKDVLVIHEIRVFRTTAD